MAQKLKFGNGTWATKEGSTLAYNDENNNYKPLPFTTTRDSIATRVNKEGLIEVVGNDVPRIDYTDSADGALLLEPQRTNSNINSENFLAPNYNYVQRITRTPNAAVSPDGLQNAYAITETTDNGTHLLGQSSWNQSIADTSVSVFAKANGRKYIVLGHANMAPSMNTWFDLENGVVGTQNPNTINATIEPYGNGWYRCSISFLPNKGNTYPVIYLSNSDGGSVNYQGDGVSGVYLWGYQIEVNGSYATSYIPTNGSAMQRAADTANGSGNSQVFNDSQGVLFANIAANTDDLTLRQISLSDGTTSNQLVIYYGNGSNKIFYYLSVGGVPQVNDSVITSDIVSFNKIAFKYKQNDFQLWINGINVLSDSSGNTYPTSTLSELNLTNGQGSGDNFYGKTKEIAYYDEILTDEELEYLTSYRSLNELVTELNLNEL